MAMPAIIDEVLNLQEKAKQYTHIQTEEKYESALDLINSLMGYAVSEPDNIFLKSLVDSLAHAVQCYEMLDPDVMKFEADSHEGPADVAMLRLLIQQHNLRLEDLHEIGSKSYVSKILNGERNLTKEHIEKLSKRFGISPAMFFESGDLTGRMLDLARAYIDMSDPEGARDILDEIEKGY